MLTGSVLDFDCQVPMEKYGARFWPLNWPAFFGWKFLGYTKPYQRRLAPTPQQNWETPHPGAVLESLLKKKSHAEKVKTEIDVVTRSDGQHGHRNLV